MLYTCQGFRAPINIVDIINQVFATPAGILTGPSPMFEQGDYTAIEESHGAVVMNGGNRVMANGLVSCSVVIYANINPATHNFIIGYVYHAFGGNIDPSDVITALNQLGGPVANIYVIYAHKGQQDTNYIAAIEHITGAGISPIHVLEIECLPDNQFGFGMDGNGNIG